MDVQEIRDARSKGVVAFTKFCQDKQQHDDCIFCFFEGEDNKYYGPRIEKYSQYTYDKIVSYNCGGRNEVIKAYNLIYGKTEYESVNKMFFIDRDYVPLDQELTDVYQTPCYSVENFYTSIDCFSRILNREFGINTIEYDFQKCVTDYCQRQIEFHGETLYLNSWLAGQRKAEDQFHLKKITLADYKVGNLFSEISIERVASKEPIVKTLLLQQFPSAYSMSDEEVAEEVAFFRNEDPQKMFRGKFELDFFKRIINSIKERNKRGAYFQIKRKCVYIDSNVNTLSSLSSYADTPECLIRFLTEHQRLAA